MDEMFFWNWEVPYAVSPWRAGLRNTSLIKTRFLQNVETFMSSANIQKHSGVEAYPSHRGKAVSIWSRDQFSADHKSSKRWALVPSTVQKRNGSCGGCVTKTSLYCPAVPPLSNAGKVYDWYCPRNGVPQQQELHPQRPCRSQLHVSTISASTFYSRFLYVLSLVLSLSIFVLHARVGEDLKNNWK